MQMKLADLRALGAYAQFSKSEMREDVLQFLATTGHLAGDVWVEMRAKSVKIVTDDRDDDEEEETLPCRTS